MGAKIADFTGGRSAPAIVQVGLHGAADLLLALWVLGGGRDGAAEIDPSTYDIGAEWFDDLRSHLAEDTQHLLDAVGYGEVWVGLMSVLPEESDNGSVDGFIEFLSRYDPVELRFRLLTLYGMIPEEHRLLAADVAEGQDGALDELMALPLFEDHPTWAEVARSLMALDPIETRDRIVQALTAVQSDIFSKFEAEFRPALERDATAKKTMARRVSPERLVEIATNGVSIEGSGYQKPIVLVPSIVGRPWVVFTESPDRMIMSYPVADEYLDADPDAPPRWLIKTYKALGDERRLRILRRLSQGSAALQDLASDMDVSKSTLHHHLMLLRSAGLLKISIGNEKEYSLRADVVPETAAVLQAYIGAGSEEMT